MHDLHDGDGVVLFDHCSRCEKLADDPSGIDDHTLQRLVELGTAKALVGGNELTAFDNLRRMARVVFASGITIEVAR